MIQILSFHQDVAKPEKTFFEFGEVDPARKVLEFHREIGILHLSGQRVFEAALKAGWSKDIQLTVWEKRRRKKRETLDVIPVRVSDQQIKAVNSGPGPKQLESQFADSGATVENDDCSVFNSELYAGSISSINGGVWTRCMN
jgi:hypothetical protein